MFLVVALMLAAWCALGWLECIIDCRWNRKHFPGFIWTCAWRDWPIYVMGPIVLLFGYFYRRHNGRR